MLAYRFFHAGFFHISLKASSSGDAHLDEYLKQHLFLETEVSEITNDARLTPMEGAFKCSADMNVLTLTNQ